jgi:3-methyladenine DNA glycosylase AlkD
MSVKKIVSQLVACSDAQDAYFLQRFFKTGPGQYGEGDRFRGIRVPVLRGLVKSLGNVDNKTVLALLHSVYHEDRLLALLLWANQCKKNVDPAVHRYIYETYLAHTQYINNWDLVDLSAEQIVGAWLVDKSRKPLYALARSSLLWDRRISIIATFHFIKKGDFSDTLALARIHLGDSHDLMHKATGWMLREVGKRGGRAELIAFLDEQTPRMPRTMLRYAIEHFSESQRAHYLALPRL